MEGIGMTQVWHLVKQYKLFEKYELATKNKSDDGLTVARNLLIKNAEIMAYQLIKKADLLFKIVSVGTSSQSDTPPSIDTPGCKETDTSTLSGSRRDPLQFRDRTG